MKTPPKGGKLVVKDAWSGRTLPSVPPNSKVVKLEVRDPATGVVLGTIEPGPPAPAVPVELRRQLDAIKRLREKTGRVISQRTADELAKTLTDAVAEFVAKMNNASELEKEARARRWKELHDPCQGHKEHLEPDLELQAEVDAFIVESIREIRAAKAAAKRHETIQRTLPLGGSDWSVT
ncbi:MAG: hypothetical protein M3P11_10800 [Actinomycetota bacterium]|nr:hypothetical protein [Actinomycetota bacterium]